MPRQLPAHTGRAPVSARGTRTRIALVQAARAVFERDGYLDARITDISAEAGVAAGSFYTYFTSKQEVFGAVMADVEEEMLHPRILEPADRDDPVHVIEAANRAYLLAYRRNARLMALMEQVSQIDEDFRRQRLRRARAFTERNARALVALQRRGVADPQLDAQLAARALSAMVSRVAYLRYVQGVGTESVEALVGVLTRLWVGALGIRSATYI
ncbi:MAG: TetR/AcrR family transcriptional regulator [Solirubrobacterales bacterium]|nr:TetR/AcrR family transcriptional regulator [Solirubrobacterales bacterium]MBV9715308.1 TetR/AcrR family transcriptional regulator [Solirubrobacterales bacterium]